MTEREDSVLQQENERKQLYGSLSGEISESENSWGQFAVNSSIHQASSVRMNSIRMSVRTSVRSLVRSSFVLSGHSCSVRDIGAGQATILSEVVSMTKNLVGAGVLSLSGGLAIYSNARFAVIAGSFWIFILGAVFGYFALLIAKACKITQSATYRECWEQTRGDNFALIVSLVNALKPALGNLAYSTILSQTFSSLAETAGWNITPSESLYIITVFCLLPLCLLKNLNVLAPFSVLGTFGILMTAAVMWIRCLDGSYREGGQFHEGVPPDFSGTRNGSVTKILPFLCMVFEAFVMHYNAPRFFTELKRNTIPRFGVAVGCSFGLSAVIYVAIATAGFLTFGGSCDSYILNNYSSQDPLASICRIAIAVSTLLTFPIVFIGFRDGVLDVLEVPQDLQTSSNLNVLTLVLLAIITVAALFFDDLGSINAVGGGTLATAVVFLFPALMYSSAINECLREQSTLSQRREVMFVMVLMTLGLVLGTIGVVESIKSS